MDELPVTVSHSDQLDPSKFDKFFTFVESAETPTNLATMVGESTNQNEPVKPEIEPQPIKSEPLVAPVDQKPPTEPAPAQTPPVEANPDQKPLSQLAAAIKADREARAARAQAAPEPNKEIETWRDRAEKAEAVLASNSKLDVVQDANAWAEAQGLTPDERAFIGEQLLYALAPHKANADVRVRMMEAKNARTQRLAEQREQQREQQQQVQRVREMHEQYVGALEHNLANLQEGTYPESEAWFGQNHQAYIGALYHQANELAEVAKSRGQMADLTFTAVAKALEGDIISRLSRRKTGTASPAAVVPAVQTQKPVVAQQSQRVETTSTRGLTTGGSPRPAAQTDQERIQRAMEVVWKTK